MGSEMCIRDRSSKWRSVHKSTNHSDAECRKQKEENRNLLLLLPKPTSHTWAPVFPCGFRSAVPYVRRLLHRWGIVFGPWTCRTFSRDSDSSRPCTVLAAWYCCRDGSPGRGQPMPVLRRLRRLLDGDVRCCSTRCGRWSQPLLRNSSWWTADRRVTSSTRFACLDGGVA